MDAITLLEKDHEKVAGIFEELEATTERAIKTRESLFAKLKQELDVHTRIEETIFYPVLEESKEAHDITLEAIEEHGVVKRLLKELENLSVDDETWGAKLKVLQENVEHHVEEEEGEMFVKARTILRDEELESLGARMEQAKETELQKSATAK